MSVWEECWASVISPSSVKCCLGLWTFLLLDQERRILSTHRDGEQIPSFAFLSLKPFSCWLLTEGFFQLLSYHNENLLNQVQNMSTSFLKASSKRHLRNISCKNDELQDQIITQMSTSLYPLVFSVLLLSRKSTEHLTPADVCVKTTLRWLTTCGTYKVLIWMLSSNEKSISVGH